MKRLVPLIFTTLLIFRLSAQDDVLRPVDPADAPNASAVSVPTAPETPAIDPDQFITEEYQIPSYNLYLQDWNTEYIKIKPLGISFGNSADIKIILVDNNNPFTMPCDNYQVSSEYGQRKSGMHTGIDLAAAVGEPVRTCFDGVVRMARDFSSYGKTVVVRHYNGLETVYAHLDSIMVQPNQKVTSGQQIGMVGNSGRSTGAHLHFETRFLYEHFNPAKMVDFTTGEPFSNVLTITKEELDFASVAVESTDPRAVQNPAVTNVPSSGSANNGYHVVKQGDTLYAISKQYKIPLSKLLEMNHLTEDSVLQLGQKIRVR